MDPHDSEPPKNPEQANPADYVDALLRPAAGRCVVREELIKGRRLRDRYLERVTIKVIAPEDRSK